MAVPNYKRLEGLTGDASADNGTTMPSIVLTAGTRDGTSGNAVLVHTAGAQGSIVKAIHFEAVDSNVASVAWVHRNNGSTPGTAANNRMIAQQSLPALTGSTTSATPHPVIPINRKLKAGERLYVSLGSTVANGWWPVCDAEQY